MKNNNIISKLTITTIIIGTLFVATKNTAFAQVVNPALKGVLGGQNGSSVMAAESGLIFATYFLRIWNTLSAVGAFLVLGYFIWAAFDWLTSAGDKGKLESARNKMIQSVIGLIILVSLYTIIGLISDLFFGAEFDILRPVFILNV